MSQIILKFLLKISFYQVNLIYINFLLAIIWTNFYFILYIPLPCIYFSFQASIGLFSSRDKELYYSRLRSKSIMLLLVSLGALSPTGPVWRRLLYATQVVVVVPHLRNTDHGEPTSFTEGSKQRAVRALYSWHAQQQCSGMLRNYGSLRPPISDPNFLG